MEGYTCGNCAGRLIPIVYGMPGPELFEAAERGEVRLGGCVVTDNDPTHYCPSCGATFYPSGDGRLTGSASVEELYQRLKSPGYYPNEQ